MPEHVMISIAAEMAGKDPSSLHELVRSHLIDHRLDATALEAAKGRSAGSAEVNALAELLGVVAEQDPQFRERLIAAFTATRADQTGTVSNQNSGQVTNLVQARDIVGDITFGR